MSYLRYDHYLGCDILYNDDLIVISTSLDLKTFHINGERYWVGRYLTSTWKNMILDIRKIKKFLNQNVSLSNP